MELNREQIVKALECCSKGDCDHCPNDDRNRCIGNTMKDALSLFSELTEERDHFELTLTGVMHFVDKWLDGEELKQKDEVARAITMREKTLRIVERLTDDNARLAHESECHRQTVIDNLRESLEYINEETERVKADTVKKLLDCAIDNAVCKDNGDGTERLFISITELRKIAKEMMEESDDNT